MIKNLAIGGSNRALLLIALLMGLVCAALVGVYLSGLDSDGGSSGSAATVPVVVTARDIPSQTLITEDMLTIKQVPADLALVGSYTEPADVVGLRTQVQMVTGQQLLNTNATSAEIAEQAFGSDAPLSVLLPAGKRAFAINVDPVASVGGLVRAGDYVDLMLSANAVEEGQALSSAPVCIVMQDIKVLAVGDTVTRASSDNDPSGVDAVGINTEAVTYSVAVTDQQALQLAAAQRGVDDNDVIQQMWVALRPFGDHGASSGPSCDLGI
jgi:pilus assembly protein CpaB